ncbi:helix-turn-helix domain-containing protein [Kitasatospora putterlickiae]|uniref:Helix-turn-helix domain-containing protein n=1 Tax=Kitasatospora putterlickiae TaxID=221725 RepID=A0ABP4IK68_9ACTN
MVSLSTDGVPAQERLGWWQCLMESDVIPVALSSDRAGDFAGRARMVELPGARVAEFSLTTLTARRTPAQIRRLDPEQYFLVLVRGAPIQVEQSRRTAHLSAGGLALYSTSDPIVADFLDRDRRHQVVLMLLPQAGLPLPATRLNRLLGTPLTTRSPAGALLGLDAEGLLPVETREHVLLARADAFIDHNLGDPGLDPAAIAAHLHISVRTLHHAFRARPRTVAATIRRRRLERCREDLTDPRQHRRTIGDIALRRGFRHPADLSRAFRAVYGVTPGELRAASAPPAR